MNKTDWFKTKMWLKLGRPLDGEPANISARIATLEAKLSELAPEVGTCPLASNLHQEITKEIAELQKFN